jgi:hypothetical protein
VLSFELNRKKRAKLRATSLRLLLQKLKYCIFCGQIHLPFDKFSMCYIGLRFFFFCLRLRTTRKRVRSKVDAGEWSLHNADYNASPFR